ncbi:MAG: T9SS type A sorting domain-containing protein [Cyclobacteriaceae bacterium]
MKTTRTYKLIVLVLILLHSLTVWSQETISSQGSHDILTDCQVSWTIGELAIEEYRSDEIIVTQGVQQPSIRIVKLGLDDESGTINIYPNPTTSIINIEVLGDKKPIDLSIITPAGTLCKSKGSAFGKTKIDLSGYPSGIYILEIVPGHKINFFKILKSN